MPAIRSSALERPAPRGAPNRSAPYLGAHAAAMGASRCRWTKEDPDALRGPLRCLGTCLLTTGSRNLGDACVRCGERWARRAEPQRAVPEGRKKWAGSKLRREGEGGRAAIRGGGRAGEANWGAGSKTRWPTDVRWCAVQHVVETQVCCTTRPMLNIIISQVSLCLTTLAPQKWARRSEGILASVLAISTASRPNVGRRPELNERCENHGDEDEVGEQAAPH